MEIEAGSFLWPHTIGKPPTAEEAVATLVNIAALEREEDGLRSLPASGEAMGRSIEDIYKGNDEGVLADVELNRTITETSRAAIGAMVRRSPVVMVGSACATASVGSTTCCQVRLQASLPWLRACCTLASCRSTTELDKLFAYLRFCLEQVCADMEMESLLKALEGPVHPSGPGGDPIRNPGVLPRAEHSRPDPRAHSTGRRAAAKSVVDKLGLSASAKSRAPGLKHAWSLGNGQTSRPTANLWPRSSGCRCQADARFRGSGEQAGPDPRKNWAARSMWW
ncbi:MAG: hypothetical protein CM15mP77_1190 [Synechococcus sp.]|nr:MAG: hypothetical protein CM15mP77_1190 [Synechococcus sp.]